MHGIKFILYILVNTIKLLKECYVITSFLLWYDAISLMMNYFNKKKYLLDRLRFGNICFIGGIL